MIRDVIKDYLPMPNISVPAKTPKMRISPLQLYPRTTLLSAAARQALGKTPVFSKQPVTFESLDQYSGFVLYEAPLPRLQMDPSILSIPKISDRAIVLIDDVISQFLLFLCCVVLHNSANTNIARYFLYIGN